MIGSFNRILTLQERVLTPDTGGGYAESWQNVAANAVLHASVLALSGHRQEEASQTISLRKFKIVTRFRSDIAAGMRMTEGSSIYKITAVLDPDGRKKTLEIMAEESGA